MEVFHHALLKYGHENAEMQKQNFDDVTPNISEEHDEKPPHTKFDMSGPRYGRMNT